jgi:hypothetical protein
MSNDTSMKKAKKKNTYDMVCYFVKKVSKNQNDITKHPLICQSFL